MRLECARECVYTSAVQMPRRIVDQRTTYRGQQLTSQQPLHSFVSYLLFSLSLFCSRRFVVDVISSRSARSVPSQSHRMELRRKFADSDVVAHPLAQ